MTQYYDLVLFGIPVALAGVTGLLSIAGVALTIAIPLGGIAAMALIGHAMFVRAPVTAPAPTPPQSRDAETTGFNSAD